MLKILGATAAGSRDRRNEDTFALAIDEDKLLVCVFDGSTSLQPIKSLGDETGAHFASHFLKSAAGRLNLKDPPGLLMARLNRQLFERVSAFEDVDINNQLSLPSSVGTVAIIDLNLDVLNWAHVGDCFGIAYRSQINDSTLFTDDQVKSFDEEVLNLAQKIARDKSISNRKAVQSAEVRSALEAIYMTRNNRPDGTGMGMVNGDPLLERYVSEGVMPLEGVIAILLGTDGLIPQGWKIEDARDRLRVLEIINNAGFQDLMAVKRESEDADPAWDHVRFKHSDDATGILIQLVGSKSKQCL
jgi:serine/threonine protein phosphatase PrpC